ncbi:HNH endonuclease [uncultured Paludibaculum sp.]|uniref:HNH endonuclease n=1 Tax=uncultured Paludibaculum sp. TaxID=1765020 RepID=UPI00374D1C63
MRCLFCKVDASASTSEEHIIPESLGNTEHKLPIGAVCDPCNNYLGRKVEQPLLESPAFRQLRRGMNVPNKRGKIPEWEHSHGVSLPAYRLMGRFLAKVGLEVLAFRTLTVTGWNTELVGQQELDPLRRFARFNEGTDWHSPTELSTP